MINLTTLSSILAKHKLTDEQSEELQKVIYMIDDGRLAEAHAPFNKADRIRILFLCDEKACDNCRCGQTDCKHTSNIYHSQNYASISEIDLKKDFELNVISPNNLVFVEKGR